MVEEVIHKGIKISVTDEFGEIETYFSNAPGSFEPLYNNVGPLKGFKSFEEAIEVGKKFVDEHQWQYVSSVDIFKIYVRLWWNGDWGYSVRCGGMTNDSKFASKEKAIGAAIGCALEKSRELKEKIQMQKSQC